MMTLALTLNGRPREIAVASRTSLGDMLRETCGLTGTHLGCEHGVCGACTVLLDGQPARSCITFAAACAGAEVTTIEGLDDDAVADALRRAFSRHHALQCGYCTPGMLISARDLVLRLGEPDERAIRVGLSGNLCRCTGYVGIVNAVKEVIAAQRDAGVVALRGGGRATLGPVGAHASDPIVIDAPRAERTVDVFPAFAAPVAFSPTHEFEHRFSLSAPSERVFAVFADVRAVGAAIPGLTLTQTDDRHAEGAFTVGLGPIRAKFKGTGRPLAGSGYPFRPHPHGRRRRRQRLACARRHRLSRAPRGRRRFRRHFANRLFVDGPARTARTPRADRGGGARAHRQIRRQPRTPDHR